MTRRTPVSGHAADGSARRLAGDNRAIEMLVQARVAGRQTWLRARKALGQNPFQPLPPPLPHPLPATVGCHTGLYEIDQLDRVTACGFGQPIGLEIGKLDATAFVEEPMTVHPIGAATILGTHVLTDRAAYEILWRKSRPRILRDPPELGTVRLMNTTQGLFFFGHWLGDDSPMREAFRDDPCAMSMVLSGWPDRFDYMATFDHAWSEISHARIADLTLYRELGFSRDKAARFRTLRARLRTGRPSPLSSVGKMVYLARGPGGASRTLTNRTAFEAAMEAAGIRVVVPEMGGDRIIADLLDAEMIISIEGSQVCHAIYTLAERGSLLILQPPDRFYNPHHEWTRLLGMAYGTVIGRPAANGFHVDPGEVFRMIDRLQAMPRQLDA